MNNKKELFLLSIILLIASFLRFFNLMHDSPYFFNPDERNMANAISQFRLPAKLSEIPNCLINQFSQNSTTNYQLPTNNCNLNPHFFAYGQFPLYLAYTSDILTRQCLAVLQGIALNNYLSTSFPSAIFWLRFWSALSSALTVLIVFLISRKLFTFHFSLFTAASAAFTPGLIQSAHFGTTESLLTFFFMVSIYLSISCLGNLSNLSKIKFIVLNSIVIGLAMGSKLTGIFFLIPPIVAIFITTFSRRHFDPAWRGRNLAKRIIFVTLPTVARFLTMFGMTMGISLLIFVLSSPYNLVTSEDFKSSVFGYESDVAMGKYEAFYTRQFVNTTPIIFQAEKVFPYTLGWPVFILGSLGFLLTTIQLISYLLLFTVRRIQNSEFRIQNKNRSILNSKLQFLIINSAFLIYFLSNAFLFAKWTRFMTPVFPFFSIFAGYFIFKLSCFICHCERSEAIPSKNTELLRDRHVPIKSGLAMTNLTYLLIGILVITSILPGLAFMSIYTHKDSRVIASEWIYQNIPNNSYVLSETANVVDIPLGLPTTNHQLPTKNYTVISFDFYHMDENPMIFNELLEHLLRADYIFIPSRRIFANYAKLPQKYPLVTKYYQLLFSGRLGFEKVAEISSFPRFPISLIRQISTIWNDESAEETYTVFDHPVIRIYKKVNSQTINQYQLLFRNK